MFSKSRIFAAVLVAAATQSAFASDGTITINGLVTANTCQINGSTVGNVTVTLPAIQASALPALNATAGTTPFALVLSGCTGALTRVSAYFEAGPTVDFDTGNLKLDTAAGSATGVEISLLNSDATKIRLGGDAASANGATPVTIASGGATLRYFAQYVRTGAVGPGTATTRVLYSLNYQ
ncbi:fimbrial protein [Variovorax sp. H27-G14]|uniref:fimbrial protein n=1 Tax=Variovorax sp. H27-G14 TaxID=3111914 RepID=UPI0038FC1E17